MAALIIGMEKGPIGPSVDWRERSTGYLMHSYGLHSDGIPMQTVAKKGTGGFHESILPPIPLLWGVGGSPVAPGGWEQKGKLNLTIMRRGENITAAQEGLTTRS